MTADERERIRKLRWLFKRLPTPARRQRHRPRMGTIPTHADVLVSQLAQLEKMIAGRKRLLAERPFEGWNFVADAIAKDEAQLARVEAALEKERTENDRRKA